MSHPTCKIPEEKTLELPKALPQDLLTMHNAEIAVTPPPSYHAVLLQKHSDVLLQPSRKKTLCPAEYLRTAKSGGPLTTPEASEKGVLKYTTAFSELGCSCTPEYARKAPWEVIEKVRRFLLHCVARDSDVDNLIKLSKDEKLYFVYLLKSYSWSWAHQIDYGWESTPPEIQLRAYKIFHLFIELPLRHLGVPVSAFLWHVKVHYYIRLLPRGSSLFETLHKPRYSTLQGLRSRGDLNRLEELLRMNDMILDSDVDNLHLYPKTFRACKEEIAAERRACIAPEMRSNKFLRVLRDHPEWPQFIAINRNRTSEFAPQYPREARKGDTNDKTRTDGGSKVER